MPCTCTDWRFAKSEIGLSGKLQLMISLAEPLRTRRVSLRSQRLCERISDLLGAKKVKIAHRSESDNQNLKILAE